MNIINMKLTNTMQDWGQGEGLQKAYVCLLISEKLQISGLEMMISAELKGYFT